MNDEMRRQLVDIAMADVVALYEKGKDYGDSWKKRGGVGAFMMLARKWDRLEGQVQKEPKWDVFEHGVNDTRTEGILDDLSDLRRYLLLVEAEIRNRRAVRRSLASPTLAYPGPYVGPHPDIAQHKAGVPYVPDTTGQTNPFGFDPYQDCRPDTNLGDGRMSSVSGSGGTCSGEPTS